MSPVRPRLKLAGTRATTAIAIVTSAAWLIAVFGQRFFDAAYVGGFVPGRVTGDVVAPGALPVVLTPLSATLVHADIVHLGFNMLMLLWCGRQVEPAFGPRLLTTIYIVGAFAAALGQWALDPFSPSVTIGASGAISAVVAVYALVFSEQKVPSLGPIPSYVVRVTWLAAAWIGLQTMIGLGFGLTGGAIAVGAHIGGFVAGLLLARPLLRYRFKHRAVRPVD